MRLPENTLYGGETIVSKWQPAETSPPSMEVVFVKLERRRGEYAAFFHPAKGWFINNLKHKDRGCHVTQWRLISEPTEEKQS